MQFSNSQTSSFSKVNRICPGCKNPVEDSFKFKGIESCFPCGIRRYAAFVDEICLGDQVVSRAASQATCLDDLPALSSLAIHRIQTSWKPSVRAIYTIGVLDRYRFNIQRCVKNP